MKNQWYHQLIQNGWWPPVMEMSFRNNEQNDEPFEVLPGVQPAPPPLSPPSASALRNSFCRTSPLPPHFPLLSAHCPEVSHFLLSKWQIQTHLVLIGSFAASDASFCSLLSISMSPGAHLLCLRERERESQAISLPGTVDALGAFRCSAELDWYWKVTEEKQYRNRERAGSGERKQLDVPRGKRNERTDLEPRAMTVDYALRLSHPSALSHPYCKQAKTKSQQTDQHTPETILLLCPGDEMR